MTWRGTGCAALAVRLPYSVALIDRPHRCMHAPTFFTTGTPAMTDQGFEGLKGLAWLLALQSLGELLAHALDLPFPGPVIGMVLLLPLLRLARIRRHVAACADFLLRHLSLLFVPVGVGVMSHLGLLSTYGLRILVAITLSTWAGMAATVWVLRVTRGRTTDGGEQ
jgi:putative effector of murein hydrolase LrgA (UPF0299 family)